MTDYPTQPERTTTRARVDALEAVAAKVAEGVYIWSGGVLECYWCRRTRDEEHKEGCVVRTARELTQ